MAGSEGGPAQPSGGTLSVTFVGAFTGRLAATLRTTGRTTRAGHGGTQPN